MMTDEMMDYDRYAEAYAAVQDSQRHHGIVGALGKSISMVWMDTNEKASLEAVDAELSRLDREREAIREGFSMDLAEKLNAEFGVSPEVATMVVRQVEVFAGDSYECIIGYEEEGSYWAHLARRAGELAEIVVFALNQKAEEPA